MRKILLTGSSGFIGESLNNYYTNLDGFEVYAPNSSILDLTDSEKVSLYLRQNNFDIVIHTANHHYHPRDNKSRELNLQLDRNIQMFSNILRCNDNYNKLIYFGSGGEYPREKWYENIKESDISSNLPYDSYGLSKSIMNLFSRNFEKLYNLRLFGVFGELDNWRYRFIPNMCVKAIFNKDLVINQNAIFDFLYINDLCVITNKFVNNDFISGDYNLCTSSPFELKYIADVVRKISKKDLKIIINDEKIDTKYGGDNSKLIKEIGEYNFTEIEESIRKVYNYLDSKKNEIDISEIAV